MLVPLKRATASLLMPVVVPVGPRVVPPPKTVGVPVVGVVELVPVVGVVEGVPIGVPVVGVVPLLLQNLAEKNRMLDSLLLKKQQHWWIRKFYRPTRPKSNHAMNAKWKHANSNMII